MGSGSLAFGCVAISWLFAVPYSYEFYVKNAFKNAATDGTCRIVNMKVWEEANGNCDEMLSGLNVWDKPCKVDVEVTHKGLAHSTDNKGLLNGDNTGIWLHFHTYQCDMATYTKPAAGMGCVDLMNTRDNTLFPCAYIIENEPPHFSVTSDGIYAAHTAELGATDKLFWSMIAAWAAGPLLAFVVVACRDAKNKYSSRRGVKKPMMGEDSDDEQEQYMVEYDEEYE